MKAFDFYDYYKDFCVCKCDCGCINPKYFTTENITETSAVIKWSGGSGGNTYTLRYKEINTDNYTEVNDLTMLDGIQGVIIQGLSANTIYAVEIIIDCESSWKSLSFKTEVNQEYGDFDDDFDEDFD